MQFRCLSRVNKKFAVKRLLSRTTLSGVLVLLALGQTLPTQAANSKNVFQVTIGVVSVEEGLKQLQRETGMHLLFSPDQVRGRTTRGVSGRLTPEEAIRRLLEGTGLELIVNKGDVYVVVEAQAPTDSRSADAPAKPAVPDVPSRSASFAPATEFELVDEILIPGMRVARYGYETPTPVTVVDVEQITRHTTGNIADLVNFVPAFAGSQTPNQNIQTAAGIVGTNGLSLRDLGIQRTLVLLDGGRSVGGTITGAADVNTFPQQLVSRIDVVTGGASAAYGSDALAGVVNFILDKTYTGTKGEVSGGITNYGDNENFRLALTTGHRFANARGHFLLSGEVEHSGGVVHPANRKWNGTNIGLITNPAYAPGNGQPQLLILNPVNNSRAAPGGLIVSGPLKGTAFGPGGAPYRFDYGSFTDGAKMYGSSQAAALNVHATQSLGTRSSRENVFARLSYDLTRKTNVFAQFGWGHADSYSIALLPLFSGNLMVAADNAFMPISVASRATALGVTSFAFGTINGDLGNKSPEVIGDRTTTRAVIGARGSLDLFGAEWSWNAHIQQGVTRQTSKLQRVINTARYADAIDAVRAPNGAIVCRSSLANPESGCVPYNLFGTGVNSDAAINYITGTDWRTERFEQNVQAFALHGEPFSNWVGPVSMAAGVERRNESVSGVAAPTGWFLGNYVPTFGGYTVVEAFLEAVAPIAEEVVWAEKLDVNAAVRTTRYSTAGHVTTWKAGLTYTPVPGLRFRATRSRDIRAPNLLELYSSSVSGTNNVYNLNMDDPVAFVRTSREGNLNLTPEKADAAGLGVVVQPTFLPGFSFSADYWTINIKDAIGSLSVQDVVDACYTGHQTYCDAITRTIVNGAEQVLISIAPFNRSRQIVRGVDLETSYAFDASALVPSWGGVVTFRALATHNIENVLDNAFRKPVNVAGQNGGDSGDSGMPSWRWLSSVSYDNGQINMSLSARGISAGTISNNYVQCASNCPTATVDHPTINYNRIAGAVYLDSSLGYKFGQDIDVFFSIRNLMNKDPATVPRVNGTPYGYAQTNPGLYDVFGRVFRAGVRFKL